jgi:hypothetical protein
MVPTDPLTTLPTPPPMVAKEAPMVCGGVGPNQFVPPPPAMVAPPNPFETLLAL